MCLESERSLLSRCLWRGVRQVVRGRVEVAPASQSTLDSRYGDDSKQARSSVRNLLGPCPHLQTAVQNRFSTENRATVVTSAPKPGRRKRFLRARANLHTPFGDVTLPAPPATPSLTSRLLSLVRSTSPPPSSPHPRRRDRGCSTGTSYCRSCCTSVWARWWSVWVRTARCTPRWTRPLP